MTSKVAFVFVGLCLATGWAVPKAAAGTVMLGSSKVVRAFETLGPVAEFELLRPPSVRTTCCRP
jgi:hypothetical protein